MENIGIFDEKKYLWIITAIQILRDLPEFVAFIHHLLCKYALIISEKKEIITKFDIKISCRECKLVSTLSNAKQRKSKRLQNINTEIINHHMFLAKIHKIFQLIRLKSRANTRYHIDLINAQLKVTISHINGYFKKLNPKYGQISPSPRDFLIHTIESVFSLSELFENCLSEHFPELNNDNFLQNTFENKGFVTANCVDCKKEHTSVFSFHQQTFEVPFEDKNTSLHDFIKNSFINLKHKKKHLIAVKKLSLWMETLLCHI